LYTVDIEFEEEEVEFYCTCPYAAEWDEPCKHAWATLLAADDRGILRAGDEKEDSEDEPMTFSRQGPLPRRTETHHHSVPMWKTTLHRLRKAAAVEPSRILATRNSRPFPSDRRMAYLLDLALTQEQRRGIVVEVMTQRRLREDVWDRPRKSSLDESQWLNA